MSPASAPLPTGTVTFLFTDVEGSTRLLQELGAGYHAVQRDHVRLLRAAIAAGYGTEVRTEGDAFFAVFPTPGAALRTVVAAQRAIARHGWPDGRPLRVRMGIHTGEGRLESGDYLGLDVNVAARIAAAGHGGQVLMSNATRVLVENDLPEGVRLRDLGSHRLKDIAYPQQLFDLLIDGLPSEFPPVRTLEVPSNLPAQLTSFVGRERELGEVGRLLSSSRLVTLTGPGGSGKTRLALRAAAEQTAGFDDGAFFVDLSTARDAESVLAGIARVLGLNGTSEQSLPDEVKRQLRERRVLLVLDNFEQVTVAAPTAVELLQECPGLKLLVTSREALHVRGEQLLPIPPLSLPEAGTGRRSAARLGRSEAVQLFVDRAQAVRPDFRLTDANADPVADICVRLDGLPLAIELATARLNLFSPEALRDRLSHGLDLLRGGARELPARQQTLRATIEWSYALLEPTEQRLFELLSIFLTGRFEAVEQVARGIEVLDGVDATDGLASLLDKSLIRLADPGDGEPRLVMLQTIREYALERLGDLPDFGAAARRAHAAYFADLARQHWERLTGPDRDVALASIAPDLENLRTAWHFWVAERDLDQLDRLIDSLWLLYDARGRYQATIELTTDLLDVLSSSPSSPERVGQEMTLRASLARALTAMRGYTREAEEAYGRALELFEAEPQLPRVFPVLRGLASFYTYRGEFEKAVQAGHEILRLAEQQSDPGMSVDGHLVVGANLAFLDDLPAGLEHLDQAIAQAEPERRSRRFRLGNEPAVACFTTSAFLLWMLGFPDRALDRANEGVALAGRLDHPFTTAYALYHSGFLHLWRREPELVRQRADSLLAVVEEHDFQIWRALGLCLLGAARTGPGGSQDGLALIRQGLDLYQGLKTPPVFWPLLRFLEAGAYARAGQPTEGLVRIDDALGVVGQSSGRMLLPEFYLLKGDMLAALPDVDAAESWLRRSLEVAHELEARMTELRAAVRLCRLRGDGDAAVHGRRSLRGTYDTFTEGFATADLTDARELLDMYS